MAKYEDLDFGPNVGYMRDLSFDENAFNRHFSDAAGQLSNLGPSLGWDTLSLSVSTILKQDNHRH